MSYSESPSFLNTAITTISEPVYTFIVQADRGQSLGQKTQEGKAQMKKASGEVL